jgi:hypothetical protein
MKAHGEGIFMQHVTPFWANRDIFSWWQAEGFVELQNSFASWWSVYNFTVLRAKSHRFVYGEKVQVAACSTVQGEFA